MKTCTEHRHEHRQLPCPFPDCPNSEGAGDTIEVPRHTGAGKMTHAEGHFDVAPPPRIFERRSWTCDKCGISRWAWVEVGAEPRMDRCPHRRAATVTPRARS
jgi:hypothetical protein